MKARLIVLTAMIVVSAFTLTGCSTQARAERKGKEAGDQICKAKNSNNANEAQRHVSRANDKLNDLARFTGHDVREDVRDLDRNLKQMSRGNATQQDVNTVIRSVEDARSSAHGNAARGLRRHAGGSRQLRMSARSLVPIVGWLPRYERRWLRGDVLAGIAVTAMIVPKDLGYAGIAGVPVQNGLYAAAAGAIFYALFCTSRQISTGPSSSLAAVAGSAVLATGLGGEQAAQLVAAIALVTGVLLLVARRVADGLDLAVPLEGGRDRFPGGSCGAGRHR